MINDIVSLNGGLARIEAALRSLPPIPDEVAERLRQVKAHGDWRCPRSSPLAVYIGHLTGIPVLVYGSEIVIPVRLKPKLGRLGRLAVRLFPSLLKPLAIPLPDGAREFVRALSHGLYPDLRYQPGMGTKNDYPYVKLARYWLARDQELHNGK